MGRWFDFGHDATLRLKQREDGKKYLSLRLALEPSVARHNNALQIGWFFDEGDPTIARNFGEFEKLSEVVEVLKPFFPERLINEAIKSSPTSGFGLAEPGNRVNDYPDPSDVALLVEKAGSFTQSRIESLVRTAQAVRAQQMSLGDDLPFEGNLLGTWREAVNKFGAKDGTAMVLTALEALDEDPESRAEIGDHLIEGVVGSGPSPEIDMGTAAKRALATAEDNHKRFRLLGVPEWKFYVSALRSIPVVTIRLYDDVLFRGENTQANQNLNLKGQGGINATELEAFEGRIGKGLQAVAKLFEKSPDKDLFKGPVQFQISPIVSRSSRIVEGMALKSSAIVAVKLSSRNIGAGLHEIGHAVEMTSSRSEDLFKVLDETGLVQNVRELTEHLPEKSRDYLLNPSEIFARLTDTMVHHRAERLGDPHFINTGGVAMTIGEWDYLPPANEMEHTIKAVNEVLSDNPNLILRNQAVEGMAP